MMGPDITGDKLSRLKQELSSLSYLLELSLVASLILNPPIIALFPNTTPVKLAAMAGLPVFSAGTFYATVGHVQRKSLWFVGVATAIGFSAASALLMANGFDSTILLLAIWVGVLGLSIFSSTILK